MSNNSDKHYVTLKKGSFVQINGNKVKLGERKGKGGEGEIYALPQNRVAKIYVEEKSKIALLVEKNSKREAKISRIISIGINNNEIAAPIALIYDLNGKFRGYEMPRVSGDSLEKLMSSPIPAERWKGWTRKNLVEACYNIVRILNGVYSIGGHDIIIGDLNLGNFMSPSPGNVVLIDFDSVQVDNLTCPVGQDKFSPPEILIELNIAGTDRSDIKINESNEKFTIAVLLFYILCGGIHPFSRKGGESPAKNILEGKFPYNEDGSVSEIAPLTGNPNYYWAFLPREIRKAFCDTFKSRDIYERTSVNRWSKLLLRYLSDFDSLVSKDSEANKIVLTRYPKWETPNGTEECVACHQFKPANQIFNHNHLCYTCIGKGYNLIQRRCKYCGTVENGAVLGDRNDGDDSDFICSTCLKNEKLTCYVCGNSLIVKHYERKRHTLDGKEICLECKNRFEDIKESIINLKDIGSGKRSFEDIPFENLSKDVEKKVEEYRPFLENINDSESKNYLSNLAKLYLQYKVQAVEFPAYQKKLKELKTKDNTVDSLKRIIEVCRDAKKEITEKEATIPWTGQEVIIEYRNLPYYRHLYDTLQQKIDDARRKLNNLIINRTKEVLSGARSDLLPDNFYQSNFDDKKFSSIRSALESLKDISDNPLIANELYVDLHDVQGKSIKGKELKEKTEIYIKCPADTQNRAEVLSKIKEVYRQVDSYRNDLDGSLCNAVQKKLNQKKDEIIQTYMDEPSKVLDEVKIIYSVETFYNEVKFEKQLDRIRTSVDTLNEVFKIKSLDEAADYPHVRGLRDELEKYRCRIEKRKELKEKTEKYFKCDAVDIKEIDEYISGIEKVRSQLSADNSYLDEDLYKSILGILNKRETDIRATRTFLTFYKSLKSVDIHSIYKSKEILLIEIPAYITGFNADEIRKESPYIWTLCSTYEKAVKAEEIEKKYECIKHVLVVATPYSGYSFFSDIQNIFQSISHELNEHKKREERLKKLETNEATVDSLKRIIGECTVIKNEITDKENTIIPWADQEGMVIKYRSLPHYRYLCDTLQQKIDDASRKLKNLIFNRMEDAKKVLDGARSSLLPDNFYQLDFDLQRIDSAVQLLNEISDYPNAGNLRDELKKYRCRIEKSKELKEKTKKYFKCDAVDIREIDEYISGIEKVRSQLSADHSYLDECLYKSILDILNKRENEVREAQECLLFYDSLRSVDIHSLNKSKEIRLMEKFPAYIKGVDGIREETSYIWNLSKDFEQAMKAEDLVPKCEELQQELEKATSYSGYRFFSDIQTAFQRVAEYQTRKKRLFFWFVVAVCFLITAVWLLIAHLVNLSDGILNVDNRIRLIFWIGWTIGIISFVICMILYKRKRKH